MQPLRWAVIGAGRFGTIHARVLASRPDIELAAVCSRRIERGPQLCELFPGVPVYQDHRELLAQPDLDVVTIATHWREHLPVACDALASGKHVLLEKPMAASADECRQILDALARAPGYLMVGHVCRFDPRVSLAKTAIEEGRLGTIFSIRSKRNLPVAPGNLRLDKISPLMGDGVHDADLMLWFLGQMPSSVFARQIRVGEYVYPDAAWASFDFGGKAVGHLEVNWRLPGNVSTTIDAELEVIGTEGLLRVDCAHTGLTILDQQGTRQPDTAYWPTQHGHSVGALNNEIAYFSDCIRKGHKPTVVTPEDAARAVLLMEAAERSAATGRPIDIPSDGLELP